MAHTLHSVSRLERHGDSGQFYNWYDPRTLAKLTVWPENGSTVYPFASSVDNGWLAAALMVVRTAEPLLRRPAERLLAGMDFGFYYDPDAISPTAPAGLLRGGFWVDAPPAPQCSLPGNYRDRGPDVFYTCHTYGSFNTEPRIASTSESPSARFLVSTILRCGGRSLTHATGGAGAETGWRVA